MGELQSVLANLMEKVPVQMPERCLGDQKPQAIWFADLQLRFLSTLESSILLYI